MYTYLIDIITYYSYNRERQKGVCWEIRDHSTQARDKAVGHVRSPLPLVYTTSRAVGTFL